MEKTQITIDQLKNYLGTGLKVKHPHENAFWILSIQNSDDEISIKTTLGIQGKLLCYRLSDLDKFIPELGFVPLDELYFEAGHSRPVKNERSFNLWKKSMVEEVLILTHNEIQFWVLSKLFQWHFWPFDQSAFDEGLVIDKLNYKTETK